MRAKARAHISFFFCTFKKSKINMKICTLANESHLIFMFWPQDNKDEHEQRKKT